MMAMKRIFLRVCLPLLLAVVMIAGCGAPAAPATTAAATTAAATTAAATTAAATTAAAGTTAAAAAATTAAATTAAPVTQAPTTAPGTAVREITAILQIGSDISLENNLVVQRFEEQVGIRMIIEAPPSDGYGDRVRILAATGDLPDLIHFGADVNAQQWASEGMLLDVTDLIPNYPNLAANISQEQLGDCIFLPDGRVYGVPKPNSFDYWGYIINKKWIDNLNLEIPKTIEDYINVCRAFTYDDPNGDRLGGTYGGGLHQGLWHLQNDFVSMAYSISGWHHGMPDADGSAKLRANKSLYGDYLKLVRAMYEEGILDREFITHTGSENREKLAQNRVGFAGYSQTGFTGFFDTYGVPMEDFVYCQPLVLHEGNKPQYAVPPSNWMAYYVNVDAKDPDAVLTALDYGNSEEGYILMQFGVQGLHYDSYDINTRTIVRTAEQNDARKPVTGNMFAFANGYRDRPAVEGGATPEFQAKWREDAGAVMKVTEKVYFGFTKMIDKIGVQFPDDAEALSTLEVRYIVGEVTFEELMSFIENEWGPKVAPIQQELVDFMAVNPPRYEMW